HFEAAARHLRQAVALAPEDGEAWYALGSAACKAGDLETAKKANIQAIALGCDDIAVHEELVWVLQSLEEWDAVIERATLALDAAADPGDRGWLHGPLGNAYQHMGDAEQTWTHY